MLVLDPIAIEAGPVIGREERYGCRIDHWFVSILSGNEEPNARARVLAKAIDKSSLAVACQESRVDQQDRPRGSADDCFHAGERIGSEPGQPGSMEAILGFGICGEDAVPGDVADASQVAHGIEEGAVEIHNLGLEAFNELSDGLGIVADGSGEDKRGAMRSGDGELVLGVVSDFLVFAFGRRHIEVAAENHCGGTGDKCAGNAGGRTRSAIELRVGIPCPVVSCALKECVEIGAIGERGSLGIAVADPVAEFGHGDGIGSGECGLGELQSVAGRHVAGIEFQSCRKGGTG